MPALSCSARSLVCEEPDAVLGLGTVRVVKFEIRYRSKDATARVVKSFDDVRAFYEAIQGSTPWFNLSEFAELPSFWTGNLLNTDLTSEFHREREKQIQRVLCEIASELSAPNWQPPGTRRRPRQAAPDASPDAASHLA